MAHVNLDNAKGIRVTCDQATISGLTLDIDMFKRGQLPAQSTSDSAPLIAEDHVHDGKYHLLLAASGSVASIKIPSIVQGLASQVNLSIRVILTESAAKFLQGQSQEQPDLKTLATYPNVDGIYLDGDEWKKPWVRGANILHIELRRWAHMLVIAPLSANTLAKISNGICDNLLTSVVRAWEVQQLQEPADDSSVEELVTSDSAAEVQKRIIVAPAMNTAMWRHPLTSVHLTQTEQFYHWFDVMRPVEKELACGDVGDGAMCDWKDIVAAIEKRAKAYLTRLKELEIPIRSAGE